MSSKKAFSIHCPLLLIVLLTLPPLATASGHQFSLFSAVKDSHNVRRDVREADDASSSSINAEEDLGGLNTGWLTDDQLSELTSAEDNEERMKKLRGFYDNLEGEAKKGATEKLIVDCYGWLDDVASEDERNALKQMHHRNHEACREKVKELLGRLGEERREQVEKRLGFCEHVWYDGKMDGEEGRSAQTGDEHHHHHGKRWIHRRRRDHQHGDHRVEDYFKTHLAWLTDDQKDELGRMKETGKSRSELKQKVIEWYDATAGDVRERATELLKGGCRELIKMVLGEEKSNKIKEMKESGTDVAKIGDQINAWIEEVTDAKKKELATEYRGICAKLFGVKSSRKRRDHQHQHGSHEGHHRVEDYFKTHLAWLTDDQKDELGRMKETGKSRSELKQKVIEWYDATAGDVRERATELLKGGCRELIKMVLGEEKSNKIKEMKESGTDVAKIGDQINAWIEEVTDAKKKELATEYRGICAKLFGVKSSRKRRDHQHQHGSHEGHHRVEDYFKTHLAWLTDDQKDELGRMKETGKSRSELKQKVIEWYDATAGDVRERATELLKGGCRELIKMVLGEEKSNKIKEMKESGTDVAKIGDQINAWIEEVTDAKKKELATEYRGICAKLFGVKGESGARRRRSWHGRHHNVQQKNRPKEDEGEVQLEDEDEGRTEEAYDMEGEHLSHHNSWLNRKQKQTLKRLRDRGHEDHELHERIHEFYDVSPEEVKATARGILQRGCESILKERRRRSAGHAEHSLEELFKSYLSWLSEHQREKLKGMKGSGKGRTEMQQKVMEWFGQLQGEQKTKAREHLRNGCRELLAHVVGNENANQLKQLREDGMSRTELEAKANEMVGAVQEEEKKMEAKEFGAVCKKLLLEETENI
uniref:Polyprotein allergen nematode domain-containing protein n=1 Tax=Globodera rostochiensis TaxID=31243 RepID=A0A914HDE2_GLORO